MIIIWIEIHGINGNHPFFSCDRQKKDTSRTSPINWFFFVFLFSKGLVYTRKDQIELSDVTSASNFKSCLIGELTLMHQSHRLIQFIISSADQAKRSTLIWSQDNNGSYSLKRKLRWLLDNVATAMIKVQSKLSVSLYNLFGYSGN